MPVVAFVASPPICRRTWRTGRSTATAPEPAPVARPRPAPKVPLDVAVSGPRLIDFAARTAERVTLAVGADPDRVAWALDLAAESRGRRRP